jgi:predicted component of type VI protein secretion system
MADLIVSLKGRELRRHALVKGETTIGRDPTNDVVIDNLGVSRTHAAVQWSGAEFIARDLGGKNGLLVNGVPSTVHQLRHGDTLQVGKFNLTLSMLDAIASPEETRPFDERDREQVMREVAAMREARASAAPALGQAALVPASPPASAQGDRVVALEGEVRSLRRALYVSVALIALLLLELGFALSKLL